MTDDDGLLADLYEAGAIPEKWPAALDKLAQRVGALGGNLINKSENGLTMLSSPNAAEITADFNREGWNVHNSRVERLLARIGYAGFLTDSDLHSEEELATLPMYAEFLNPRGASAGAATIIQGAGHEGLIVALEGFASHDESRQVARTLDALRPHLARAAALSATIQQKQRNATVQMLEAMEVPAGFIDEAGRLREANGGFRRALDKDFSDHPTRMRLRDADADAGYVRALQKLVLTRQGSSIALRDASGVGRAVLHIVPLQGEARDMFSSVVAVAIVAGIGNRALPQANMLAALFDLTPIEAQIAQLIAGGETPKDIAAATGKTTTTVRFHLKQIYQKTGTNRQAGLALLLSGIASPSDLIGRPAN